MFWNLFFEIPVKCCFSVSFYFCLCVLWRTALDWKNSEFLIWPLLNLFQANAHFLSSLKISENQRFSDVFKGYTKGTLYRNRLRYYYQHHWSSYLLHQNLFLQTMIFLTNLEQTLDYWATFFPSADCNSRRPSDESAIWYVIYNRICRRK